MNPFEQYHSKTLCEALVDQIHLMADKPLRFMEVCGGHTMAIRKYGIPSLLPDSIMLLSGPGCPVCVTSSSFIDQAIYLAADDRMTICTFGDLLRVPGTNGSLEKAKTEGGDIRVVLSGLNALEIARKQPEQKIVFLGIGFETTAPTTAATILTARKEKISNFFVLSAHKLMPPAMEAIISEGIPINGYICPGHVTTITGTSMYNKIVEDFGIGCVVSGFEPLDLLQTIYLLVMQIKSNQPKVENQYSRAVKPQGNCRAMAFMEEVFEPVDAWWRGLGVLKSSGLKPGKSFQAFDASEMFNLPVYESSEPETCICGDILKGLKQPQDCRLYGKTCTPNNPVGACMVSSEGSCQTHYNYAGVN